MLLQVYFYHGITSTPKFISLFTHKETQCKYNVILIKMSFLVEWEESCLFVGFLLQFFLEFSITKAREHKNVISSPSHHRLFVCVYGPPNWSLAHIKYVFG
jgi:hypothetical protein